MKAIRRFTVRTVLPASLAPLDELSTNLRWSWHEPTRRLFHSIDAELWESTNQDPIALRIDPQFDQIPDDSDAGVQTQGLLGGKYIGIGPGGSDTYLKDGGRIELTQSALVLENLINKLFASFVSIVSKR